MKTLLFLLFSFFLLSPSFGDTSWQNTLSKAPAGPFIAKKKHTLNYKLTWKGSLKSGEVTVNFKRNTGADKTIELTSSGKSSGAARRIYPYDFKCVTKYKGDTLRPVSYHIWESTKKESKTIDGYFAYDRVNMLEKSTSHKTKVTTTKRDTFQYPNLMDLFTATLHIGSLPLNNGDEINLVTYPFDKPYLIMVKVLGREKHNGQDCIKLDLQMKKVRSDLTLKSYEKMKKTTMWISDDTNRVMVDLRAKIFIGDVRCTLESSTWE